MTLLSEHPKYLAAALCQLLAVAILQSYFLLPVWRQLMPSHASTAVCRGDHRLCGCSPERVAARTCCCLRPPSCNCQDHALPEREDPDRTDTADTRPALRSAPCGSMTEYAFVSLEKLKFIIPPLPSPPVMVSEKVVYPAPVFGAPDQFREPPDPPPRALTRA